MSENNKTVLNAQIDLFTRLVLSDQQTALSDPNAKSLLMEIFSSPSQKMEKTRKYSNLRY